MGAPANPHGHGPSNRDKGWRMEWSTPDHTGTAIPLFAFGPGSQAFAGYIDNTDVGRKLLSFVRK